MEPITMGLIAGGSSLLQSILGGQGQMAQNAVQRAQFQEREYQRQLTNQIKNRNIAKANAAKWMQNIKIGEAASKARGEQEFWMKYNFDNATGQFSRQQNKINESIQSSLLNRNINPNSGTARALLRESIETSRRGMTSRGVQFSNAMISAERQQSQMLAKRDFGYQDQEKFLPGQLFQQSDSSIMQNALVTGLISGAASGFSAYAQQHASNEMLESQRTTARVLGEGNVNILEALQQLGQQMQP